MTGPTMNEKLPVPCAENCLFCSVPIQRIILENVHCYGIQDGFPVTSLHTLVIPKRHVEDWFGLSQVELIACNDLLRQARLEIIREDPSVHGFNIGSNCGEVSGQTVFHCHIHLMPRRKGDTPAPRGGVRHIIPGKGSY